MGGGAAGRGKRQGHAGGDLGRVSGAQFDCSQECYQVWQWDMAGQGSAGYFRVYRQGAFVFYLSFCLIEVKDYPDQASKA